MEKDTFLFLFKEQIHMRFLIEKLLSLLLFLLYPKENKLERFKRLMALRL